MGLILVKHDYQVFCVNASTEHKNAITDDELREFLESYFPAASRFEKQTV